MFWYEFSPQQTGIKVLGDHKLLLEQISNMLVVKFEVEKFDYMNDYILLHIKMKALLVQHNLEGTLEGKAALAPILLDAQKRSIRVKTSSIIQLSLSNKSSERCAIKIWHES